MPQSYVFRPGLTTRDYHEKVIQNKTPPKTSCIPISETAAKPNRLTQSQKRDTIIDSCQRTRTLQSIGNTQTNPYVHETYTHFRHWTQSTAPGYFDCQKEVRKRYSLKISQKRQSNKNGVNADAVIDSSVDPNFCFSQTNKLTATTCIAHSVSSEFAMGNGLASTLVCSYPDQKQMQKMSLNFFTPGSLVA